MNRVETAKEIAAMIKEQRARLARDVAELLEMDGGPTVEEVLEVKKRFSEIRGNMDALNESIVGHPVSGDYRDAVFNSIADMGLAPEFMRVLPVTGISDQD